MFFFFKRKQKTKTKDKTENTSKNLETKNGISRKWELKDENKKGLGSESLGLEVKRFKFNLFWSESALKKQREHKKMFPK